ncbi:hypothetical protein LMH87_010784 [Akanthomyces muscarius]|uniref:SH3 domain-containing protein n=1 Tax=Akanthomyces muscarius TaxID=2231603 RepID=A0A9W8Q9B3_AKAMU|nr:hypothetical protein LMH87_010784 [Akanthomyces muscarius]KAJ4150016.1 hypothetical protein LMH87_010784 [Akanthomyces muscarius]
MTRPSIIRADTIDLQDHDGPSTQNQSHPEFDPDDIHHRAPHQAETLREVAHETAQELRSPIIPTSPTSRGRSRTHQSAPGTRHAADFDDSDTQDPDAQAADLTDAFTMDSYRQHEQDAIVAAHNGASSSDEEDLDGEAIDDLDDDLMDKISSSPSIEDEDIDFEFVYALHTFVATVEGQANATKGDTMVLLDDSNSYWWLVRVVKDSSIGYLPAEHIETPTERLARLNKHRNIDLSATMLGDQAVKQKSSFKAIRRKRKTVAFAEPTYVDYSDFDYSTDEEDIEELFGTQPQSAREQAAQSAQQEGQEVTEEARVEPLRTKDPKSEENQDTRNAKDINGEKAVAKEGGLVKDDSGQFDRDGDDDTSSVEEIIDETTSVSRSRNGTVRNTDSFFNDEETKKITLTPNLLRDSDAAGARPSTDSAGKDSAKSRSSLEKMERELVSDKERKKTKDKKPSAIRSFFSRKDKKKSEEDDESFGKRSMDAMDADERDEAGSPDKAQRIGKLQKPQPRLEPQPQAGRKFGNSQAQNSTVELSSYLNETRTNDVSSVPPASMRIVDPETQETRSVSSNQLQQSSESAPSRSASSGSRGDKASAALSKIMPHRSPSSGADPKPQKTKKAKMRMELEANDSSEEEEQEEETTSPDQPHTVAGTAAATAAAAGVVGAAAVAAKSRGAPSPSSPVMSRDRTVTPQTGAGQTGDSTHMSPSNASNPPGLVPDTSSAEDRSPNASPSPELMSKGGSAASSRKEAWDDVKLRAFFDESDHIRDLLAVVYDKSDVEPVGADHPAIGGLFREQNAKLAEITTQLDNLLGDWLARKQRMRGSA